MALINHFLACVDERRINSLVKTYSKCNFSRMTGVFAWTVHKRSLEGHNAYMWLRVFMLPHVGHSRTSPSLVLEFPLKAAHSYISIKLKYY